jgi:DNA polymerase (family 10)
MREGSRPGEQGRSGEAGAPNGSPGAVNAEIGRRLEEVGRLLAEQGANPFRAQAYEHAAATLRGLDRSAAEILREEGLEGLERLPGIGPTLARAIRDVVRFGKLPMLERLRGEMDPERLLASVPGIGRRLARRLHEGLGIDSLEDLEAAAHDGRLASVAGFGAKKIAGVVDTLASRLRRVRAPGSGGPGAAPEVAELLDVDEEYRRRAAAGDLRRIAPRRFNPRGEAWLPVLHTERGGRHYTALFSNTARAHELGKTRDWVVLYHDGGSGERQNTVITAQRGPLLGRRLVIGKENECRDYYVREGGPRG